jgi:hypothetical protein
MPGTGLVHTKSINTTHSHTINVNQHNFRGMKIKIKNTENEILDFNGSNNLFLFELFF